MLIHFLGLKLGTQPAAAATTVAKTTPGLTLGSTAAAATTAAGGIKLGGQPYNIENQS